MEKIFELKDIVWFLLGWLIPVIVKVIANLIKEARLSRNIKRENDKYISSGDNVFPLSHGTPFFNSSHLVLTSPTQEFYFSMPKDSHDRIVKINPDFEHTKWEKECFYWNRDDGSELIDSIKKLNCELSCEDIKGVIESQKEKIAKMFLERSSEAFFNGEMYGISRIEDRRVGNTEEAKIVICSFKTDYYTHRVMASVYQKLLDDKRISPPGGLINLNSYFPFLTSMGMDVLLVIENKRKVVLTKRSKQLINMKKDQWHVSMNEAISITDLNMGSISLNGCVSRGLCEELGLQVYNYSNVNIVYSDLFMLTNPIEVGILAFAVINDLNESEVRDSYNIAQDAPFESTGNDENGLLFLPLSTKDINEFCSESSLTDVAKYALKMLRIRKDQLP